MHALYALVIIFEHCFKVVKDNVKWYHRKFHSLGMFSIVFCALNVLLSIVNAFELSVHKLWSV